MKRKELQIQMISNNGRIFIVAELSANHGGDLEIAKRSIAKAKEIGCDAVKIQTLRPDLITIECDSPYFKVDTGTIWDGTTLFDLYSRTYLPWEWHRELFDYAAKEVGITLFSSPFDRTAVDLLEDCGNPIYKIASFEITDVPLVKYAASTGKPMVISTGIATEEEILDAVDACRPAHLTDLVIVRVDHLGAGPEGGQTLRRHLDRQGVTVQADDPGLAETFGHGRGMTTHPDGRVHAHGAIALQCRTGQLQEAPERHRDVSLGNLAHDGGPS
jgi:pseudaminic acid synthase